MSPPESPRGNAPPHIRLNSGTKDITESQIKLPGPARQPSPRSLTFPLRPPTSPTSASPYRTGNQISESSEHLLPPVGKSRRPGFRDESPWRGSAMSSRRTSWSSDSVHSQGPFASPFDDSRAPSRAGSEEDLNTQTVSEKFNILPGAGLLLFPEDVEKDDWLHNPDPNEKDTRDCDIFTPRGMINMGGLIFLTLGIIVLFVVYPVVYVTTSTSAPSSGWRFLNRLLIFT